jgi:hypothetical protein
VDRHAGSVPVHDCITHFLEHNRTDSTHNSRLIRNSNRICCPNGAVDIYSFLCSWPFGDFSPLRGVRSPSRSPPRHVDIFRLQSRLCIRLHSRAIFDISFSCRYWWLSTVDRTWDSRGLLETGREGLGLYYIFTLLGPVLGPIVGGFIVRYSDWLWMFYSTSTLSILIQALHVQSTRLWMGKFNSWLLCYRRVLASPLYLMEIRGLSQNSIKLCCRGHRIVVKFPSKSYTTIASTKGLCDYLIC